MKHYNLLEDPVEKLFLNYLLPSISAMMVTSIYILADTMMIGRGIGALGIAALNIVLPLYSTYYGIGMLCGIGGSVLFGFSKGKGDEREARAYFTTALLMVLTAAVLGVFFGHLFFGPLTRFLGRTDTMEDYVNHYGKILVSGAPIFMISSFLQAFVRNDGAPRLAMAGVISGGVTNCVLDYIYIYILGWGMGGAALATATGSTLTVLILSTHFFSPGNSLKPVRCVSLKRVWQVAANGMASFILEISNGLVMFLFNRQLLKYVGELGVVVYSIISNTSLVVTSLSNGMSQAVQPLLSANYGAGRPDRVRRTKNLGLRVAFFAGLAFAATGLFFPVAIAHLFIEPTEEILTMAVPAIRIYFLSFLTSVVNIMCGTYFQATVRAKASLFISLSRGVLFNSILVFVLPLLFGVTGIWMTVAVSETITIFYIIAMMKRENCKELV